ADAKSNNNTMWRQLVMQQIGQALSQPDLMPEEAARIFDIYLSHHAARTNQHRNQPTFRPSTRSAFSRQNNQVIIWTRNYGRSISRPFPAPTDYFYQKSLGILKTNFNLFKA